MCITKTKASCRVITVRTRSKDPEIDKNYSDAAAPVLGKSIRMMMVPQLRDE